MLDAFSGDLVLHPGNWKDVAAAVANDKNQIIFTTFQGQADHLADLSVNFLVWLHANGLSRHTLLISTDVFSCEQLWERGVPCWLDEACPRADALPPALGKYRVIAGRSKTDVACWSADKAYLESNGNITADSI